MRLDQYQWSQNPRGLHGPTNFQKAKLDHYTQIHAGWMKLVVIGDEYLNDIPVIVSRGITPIIRVYHQKFGASPAPADQMRHLTAYVGAGARWFELYNEPNLRLEWPDTIQPDFTNVNDVIAPLMTNWLQWAEMVINVGGYPAFPAISETVGNFEDVTSWLNAMMNYLAATYYDRFRAVANSGLWCATHPYYYNHFYQEAGKPWEARQAAQQNGLEGGWHFEYPYDPITQRDDPGRSVLGATPTAPRGDPIGLTGMGSAFMQRFTGLFGGNMIPVIGTEGGITPLPRKGAPSIQTDNRFPGYDWNSHAEATLAAFNWIAYQAPAWMFGLTLWTEPDYFADNSADASEALEAVRRMADVMPAIKAVPAIEALLPGPGPGPLLPPAPGPGPIHGAPDLHMLILAPEFDPALFFDAAGAYWEKYRPPVLTTLDLIGEVPSTKSLAVTLIAPKDKAEALKKSITDRGPHIYVDVITPASAEELGKTLNARVLNGQRLG